MCYGCIRVDLPAGATHQIVRDYLVHYGYADTLAAFDSAAGAIPGGAADEDMGQDACVPGFASYTEQSPSFRSTIAMAVGFAWGVPWGVGVRIQSRRK